MDRCKLEYMIKRFDFKEKKKMITEIDPYGDYDFKTDISTFLSNIDTTDIEILQKAGPSSMVYYISYYDMDTEIAMQSKAEMEKEVKELKEKFINKFKSLNELCIKNNTFPFFKDPYDLKECEKTRLDIVKIIPEEIINKFFGVECLRDYEPPIYNGDE